MELEENDEVEVITEKPRRGYRLVEYQPGCEDDVSYVGYVRTRDLFQPEYGLGYGCGRGGMGVPLSWGDFKEAPRVKVEAGRFLLMPNEARVVGCAVKSLSAASLGDGLHAVPTIWGPVKVRLAPEGFDGACGTEQ